MRDYREISLWKDVPSEKWKDWKWQFRNRIKNLEILKKIIDLTCEEEEGIKKGLGKILRMATTPYYLTLAHYDNPDCPIRRQAIPTKLEFERGPFDITDPLSEEADSPAYFLTHRYPDRVLLLATDLCSNYCRHCTRSRMAGGSEKMISKEKLNKAIEYIKNTPQIRDVLISGGDPLTLDDEILEEIIKDIRAIPHVEIIRIGTRVPVVLPMRITEKLCKIFKKYHPLWINTHFNHPYEITPLSKEACSMLADAGIPLGNQSVLLKGINDCPHIMKKLMHELVKIRVRPYYLYQCDLTAGIEHFRTSVSKGIEIMESLRGHTSGFCVPNYMIDAPGGGGKIPVSPQYLISFSEKKAVLRNYEGVICSYTQPDSQISSCPPTCSQAGIKFTEGVSALLEKDNINTTLPLLSPRQIRRKKLKRNASFKFN